MFTRPTDKVGDNQKITGESHLDDDPEFFRQALIVNLATLKEIGGGEVEQTW